MRTSFKKLLLVSITLLLGVMSGGVMAQATYNFEFVGNNGGSASLFFTVDSVDSGFTITNVNGTVNGHDHIIGLANFGGPSNSFYPTGVPGYVDFGGVSFRTDSGYDFALYLNGTSIYRLQSTTIDGLGNVNYFTSDVSQKPKTSDQSDGSMFVGAAAPEIDGSLAPKAGFLLGCLFLMFGRKKQNTEPMMTA